MSHGESLLSKVLDDGSTEALRRFSIEQADFGTEGERAVYEFIADYAKENRGKAPDYRTVVEHVPEFYYRAEDAGSYEWLAKKVKEESGIRRISALVGGDKAQSLHDKKDFESLSELLLSELQSIKMGTSVRESVGTDIKRDTDKFLAEYRERKAGTSFKIWRSKFATINKEIGGYYSGNVFTWYGRSGRGKSIFVMEEAIEAAMQGANVLVWALEMSMFEWMARAYSSISARKGYIVHNVDGVDYEAGFENRELLQGGLSEEFESGFEIFLAGLNESIPGNITLRAVDDEDFYHRNLRELEKDITLTEADVVVIDPAYFLQYEKNTSKTAGGDLAETSKKLRHISGFTKAVIHVITQAEEIRDESDDEGNRELRAPKRAEIKKSKSLLEDASNTFGIDTLDGRGIIELGKGRNGGEGATVEVRYLPNFGLVVEDDAMEEAAKFTGDPTSLF